MSRCFPYPPPGYTLSRANKKEVLIESIELQKEREKSIKELKQKSEKEHKENKEKSKKEHKEKKEKSKNEHKEKDKEQRKKDKEQRKKDKKKEKQDKSNEKDKSWHIQKRCKAEPVQLERSNLTEEHGQAVCPNAPSCSLDSTENSNKRKRQSSPEDVSCVHGKVIRIKLSKKPDDSGPSTSGRAQLPTQPRNDIGLGHTRNGLASISNDLGKFSQGIPSSIVGEQICTTSRQINMVAPGVTDIRKPTKIPVMSPMQKMELEYNTLFENLAQPQQLDAFLPDDDLDWLIPAKNMVRSTETESMSGNTSTTCSGSQTLWPCSQYLQEVDVYALPYTVPF